MKNKKVKVITLLLALLLMLPAMVSAATYKDVDTSHWAYEYITKLSNDRVITGYPDGTYLPNKNVAYLEVLKLLYGVMNPDVEELGKARIAHNTDVVGAGVPDWAQDSVDMALYRDVINVSNLTDAKNANMISNNPVNVPDRQTIAMYFAKALGMSESDDFTVLKHKDVNEIPEINKKYLVPLVKAGIFDPTGSDGNFEGRRGIRRAEMAKITYLAHEYMKKYGLELTMEGKVIIEPRKDTNVFFIEKKDGNAESFGFDKDTKFTLNGKEIKAEDVKEGQEAKVTYVKTDSHQSGKLAKKVELKTDEIPAVGYVLTVMDKALEVNYAENVIDVKYDTKDSVKVDKKGVFILAKDAKITRYDKTIELKDVKVNDFVEFTLKDNQITGIKVIPQNFEITGELVKIDDRKADDKFAEVTLKLSDKKEHVFYVEKIAGSQGQYFGQKYNVNGLESKKIGENVTFTLKYKLIEKLGKSIDKKNLIGTIPVLHTKDYSYPNSEGTWKPHSINEADVISIEFLSRDGKINEKFKLGTGYTVRTPDNIRKGITDTKGKQVQITLNNYNEVIAVIVYDKDAVVDVEGKLVVNSIKNSKNIGKIEVTSRILEGVKPDSFQGQTLIFEVDSTQNNKYKEGSVHSFTAKHDGIDSFIELNFPTN